MTYNRIWALLAKPQYKETKMKRFLAIMSMVLVSPLSACSEIPHPIPTGSNSAYYGRIESGEKFGISIGEDRKQVRHQLEGGGAFFVGIFSCNSTIRETINCVDGDIFEIYNVKKFLKTGTIFIKYNNESVSLIAWSFKVVPKPDF